MTYFESGFIKQAEEYGLSEQQAILFLKRAFEHPEAEALFKRMPQEEASTPVANIKNLLATEAQKILHEHAQADRKKIELI